MNKQPTIHVGDHWYAQTGHMGVERIVIHDITKKTVAIYTPLPAGKTPEINRYKIEDVDWVELIKMAAESSDE